jgi:hypothetical protein
MIEVRRKVGRKFRHFLFWNLAPNHLDRRQDLISNGRCCGLGSLALSRKACGRLYKAFCDVTQAASAKRAYSAVANPLRAAPSWSCLANSGVMSIVREAIFTPPQFLQCRKSSGNKTTRL